MQTFHEALEEGYETADAGSWTFSYRDDEGNEYELWFERLLFDNQYYVALYKNRELLTNKVPIKPGKENDEE